jgi:hypothetical protein
MTGLNFPAHHTRKKNTPALRRGFEANQRSEALIELQAC